MLKLFRIEWMKVRSYRAFWVLFGAFVLLYPLCFYFTAKLYYMSEDSAEARMLKGLMGDIYSFPRAWWTSGWLGGLFFVIIGMLFVLLITNEVQYRTHRQNIIDGWSRIDFLKAKFSMMIFLVLVATVLVAICGLLAGLAYSNEYVSWTDGIYYLLYFVLMASMYLLVAFLIAILVKRTGLSIVIYFGITIFLDNVLFLYFTYLRSKLAYFWPLESTDSLFPFPYKPQALARRSVTDGALIIAACIYLLIFAVIIVRYFRKTDLKT